MINTNYSQQHNDSSRVFYDLKVLTTKQIIDNITINRSLSDPIKPLYVRWIWSHKQQLIETGSWTQELELFLKLYK